MARTTRTRKRKASVELSREPPDSRAIPLVKTPDEETSTSRSSLLSLPRELRDKIFYYAVLPPNFILIGDDDLLPRPPMDTSRKIPEHAARRFFLVNKQIRDEASRIYYSKGTVAFSVASYNVRRCLGNPAGATHSHGGRHTRGAATRNHNLDRLYEVFDFMAKFKYITVLDLPYVWGDLDAGTFTCVLSFLKRLREAKPERKLHVTSVISLGLQYHDSLGFGIERRANKAKELMERFDGEGCHIHFVQKIFLNDPVAVADLRREKQSGNLSYTRDVVRRGGTVVMVFDSTTPGDEMLWTSE